MPKRREQWFDRGAYAYQQARPGSPAVYCCPLCLRHYDKPDSAILTLEDVPPLSVGGRPLVLTCKECNNEHGSKIDFHAAAGKKLQDWTRGDGALNVRVSSEGAEIGAVLRKSADGFDLAGVPEQSNPADHAQFFGRLAKMHAEQEATGKLPEWEFTVKINYKHSLRKEELSWLRAAYLTAFASMGYTYILRTALDPIRAQLAMPERRIIPILTLEWPVAGDDRERDLAIIFEPADRRAVTVRFGARTFLLPDLIAAPDFYDRMSASIAASPTCKPVMLQLAWPTEPVFFLDFEPTLRPLVLPSSIDLWRAAES